MHLEQSPDNWGDHRVSVTGADGEFGEAARHRITVPSTRLDTLVNSAELPKATLLWMDTQGYEGFVLKGATALLRERFPLVSEFWPYGMKRAGGFSAFKEAVAHYQGFIELNGRQTALRPMSELDPLFQALDGNKESYTDILII